MRYGAEDDELENSTTNVMIVGLFVMFAFVAVFPLYRVLEPANREEARATQLASLADEGANLFSFNCASCHGEQALGGDSPALNSKEFLQMATNEQIELIIAVGIPGTAMSAYSQDFAGPLTSAQIRALSTYLRSLEDDAPSNPNWRKGALPDTGGSAEHDEEPPADGAHDEATPADDAPTSDG